MANVSTVCALSGKTRQEAWRDRLQAFASKPPEEMGDEWGLFLKELGLTNGYYLAVCEVLKQGRWTTAPHPRAYVKKAATIEARKMHLSISHKDDTLECGDCHLVFMAGGALDKSSTREATQRELDAENREHGKPRVPPMKGLHFVAEQYDYDGEFRSKEAMIAENKPRLPHDWWIKQEPDARYLSLVEQFNRSQNERHIEVPPKFKLDWKRLAGEARLDPWECRVLEYHRQGVSRDRAMSEQPDNDSRLAIQAAWKRFDRTGRKKLQDCLKKNEHQDVPDEHPRDTRRVEATGCPPDRRMKVTDGKALQAVWKRTGGKSREDLGRFLSNYRAAMYGRGPTQFADARLVKIIGPECPE